MVYAQRPMKQSSFFPKPISAHGGELALGRRKALRPLARRKPIHLVLKSKRNLLAQGSLLQQDTKRFAAKFGLRVYDSAIAKDHLHLVVMIPGRREYSAFIRALTGLLARKLGKGLWSLLPFSRVASWGKEFQTLLKYLEQNRLEAEGVMPYQKRSDWYRKQRRRLAVKVYS